MCLRMRYLFHYKIMMLGVVQCLRLHYVSEAGFSSFFRCKMGRDPSQLDRVDKASPDHWANNPNCVGSSPILHLMKETQLQTRII